MIQVFDSMLVNVLRPNLPNLYIYNLYRVIGTYTIQCYPPPSKLACWPRLIQS